MKKIFTILMLISLNSMHQAFACDCVSKGEFLTVASKSKLVALVKVAEYLTYRNIYDEKMPMSMLVEIIEVYKGREIRKTVTVWGDDGGLCRPYLNRFKLGNYYIIAFDEAGIAGTKAEKKTDYAISICGDYWLDADTKSKKAKGMVTKNINAISFQDLRKKLSGK
jgi:hypothetical protein